MKKTADNSGRRRIICSNCVRPFKTQGTTRVLRHVVFHFCERCWMFKRNDCEQFAQGVAR